MPALICTYDNNMITSVTEQLIEAITAFLLKSFSVKIYDV